MYSRPPLNNMLVSFQGVQLYFLPQQMRKGVATMGGVHEFQEATPPTWANAWGSSTHGVHIYTVKLPHIKSFHSDSFFTSQGGLCNEYSYAPSETNKL